MTAVRRRLAGLLGAAVVLVATSQAFALEVPRLARRVTDQAGVLSRSERDALEAELERYERATGHQLAVLVIPSLQGEGLEQFSIRVVDAWRLGDERRDDGALLLVAMQDRAIRIEVGRGLEGALTDVASSRIVHDVMIPRLREGDPAGGIRDGVNAMMQAARGEAGGAGQRIEARAPARSPREGRSDSLLGKLMNGLGAVGLVLLAIVAFLPWWVRVALGAVVGVVVGFIAWGTLGAVLGGPLGMFLGLALPAMMRASGRSSGWSSAHGSRSSGFGGAFRGGGGSFGGGGASGRW